MKQLALALTLAFAALGGALPPPRSAARPDRLPIPQLGLLKHRSGAISLPTVAGNSVLEKHRRTSGEGRLEPFSGDRLAVANGWKADLDVQTRIGAVAPIPDLLDSEPMTGEGVEG